MWPLPFFAIVAVTLLGKIVLDIRRDIREEAHQKTVDALMGTRWSEARRGPY